MRTWVLAKTMYNYTNETRWDGPELAEDEAVEVIELGPVLDLLERATADTTVIDHGRAMIRSFIEGQRRGA